jgi:hypothetical protein
MMCVDFVVQLDIIHATVMTVRRKTLSTKTAKMVSVGTVVNHVMFIKRHVVTRDESDLEFI